MVPNPVKHMMEPQSNFNYPRLYPRPSTIPYIKHLQRDDCHFRVLANNSLALCSAIWTADFVGLKLLSDFHLASYYTFLHVAEIAPQALWD